MFYLSKWEKLVKFSLHLWIMWRITQSTFYKGRNLGQSHLGYGFIPKKKKKVSKSCKKEFAKNLAKQEAIWCAEEDWSTSRIFKSIYRGSKSIKQDPEAKIMLLECLQDFPRNRCVTKIKCWTPDVKMAELNVEVLFVLGRLRMKLLVTRPFDYFTPCPPLLTE